MSSDYGLKRGTMIGPYRIIRLIGRGGMGEVYEAFEEGLNRRVAIKMILKEHIVKPEIKQRFEIEGRALAQIIHPNVVTVHSLAHFEGSPYLAMEFVEGVTLSDYLKKRVFPVNEAVTLFSQLLHGVEALHANKIIHRDLKPNNIIYQSNHVVKIVDFGVAKIFEGSDVEITNAGVVIGSAKYISPEGARGEPATFQSDIWSLGVLFYQMLIGHTPFEDTSYLKVLDKVKSEPIRMPVFAKMMIPKEIRQIIMTMLQRELHERYNNTTQIISQLETYIKANESNLRRPKSDKHLSTLHLNVKNEKKIYSHLKNSGYDNFRTKMILTIALNEQAKIDGSSAAALENTLSEEQSKEITISDKAMNEAIRIVQSTNGAVVDRRSKPREPQKMKTSFSYRSFFLQCFAVSLAAGLTWIGFKSFYMKNKNQKEMASNQPFIETLPVKIPEKPLKPPQEVLKTKRLASQKNISTKLVSKKIKGIYRSKPPRLKWVSSQPTNYQLIVATDRNFRNIVQNELISATEYTASGLEAGKYYWRVQAWGSGKAIGPVSKTGTIQVFLKSPRLRQKYNASQTINAPGETKQGYSISRSFSPVPGAYSYEVLASRNRSFKKAVKKSRVKKPQFELLLSQEGKYYVKVAALDKNRKIASSFSNTSTVQFQRKYRLQTPRVISPADGRNLGRQGRNPASVSFFWKPIRLADKYELQFSLSKNFSQVFSRKISTQPQFEFTDKLPVGTVYWRVRSIKRKSRSSWSAPRRIVIPPPK